MRKVMLLASCLLFFISVALAQQTITGKITDQQGSPLEGVSIKSKKTGRGVITAADGSFRLDLTANDELEVSMIGFVTKSVKAGSQTTISISLEPNDTELSQIILVGTRSSGRVKTESPVPVDVIDINKAGLASAKMDLTSVLNYAAPSFNYNKQSGADGADHIDLGTLRGLGPDQTLVLINGKRRHQTAFVALFGTRGRGNSGVDMNAFPSSAVDRIEILRDGASAQYGSDAMAGVINVVLKKNINQWNINAGWSGYYDTKYNASDANGDNEYYAGNKIDGNTFRFTANTGYALGKNGGFINLSAEFRTQGKTYRQVRDTNVWTNKDALPLNSGRRAFGDASIDAGGAMYNLELPFLNGKTTFYSFGGYNYKKADAFAYTRNFSGRPDRFPVDNNGDLLFVPSIMKQSKTGETYYNPHIQTKIQDMSVAAGLKGKVGAGWNWDASNTIGRNDFHYYGDKTFNASLINQTTPNKFDDGGFNFLQNTTNVDFSKAFVTVADGLNLGLGAEFRYERYSIYKGEEASYQGYVNPFDQAPGAQGFPGFSPADEIAENRTTFGVYADAELNVTKEWLVDGAVRFENYSDFGSVVTGKIATRYKVAPHFNIRGSFSSGYRAPSLQQINFSNTLTSFSGGQLVQSRIARNGDAVTMAAGIPDLKQETSINGSIGFTYRPIKDFTITVDGYAVKIRNRIVLSGLFSADDPTLPVEFTSQLQAIGASTAQFFANSVNTTNYGLDIVLDYTKKWGDKSFKALLAGNIQSMTVDKVNIPAKLDDSYVHRKTFFSDREETFLKASAPRAKFSLNLEYGISRFSFGTLGTYFGKQQSMGFGWTGLASQAGTGGPGDPAISGSFTGIDPYVDIDGFADGINVLPEVFRYGGKVTIDIYGSYKISKATSLYIGVDNILNEHPDFAAVPRARYESFDNETGGPWESVQMGFNGMRLFAKLAFNF